MISICNNWEFSGQWYEGFASGEGSAEPVRLPHTVAQTPLHYADHEAYQMVCGYRRKITLGSQYRDKRIFLQFDGAAHIATVYMNGREVAHHRCGYTGFRADVTDAVVLDSENILAVKLDTTENPLVPPFGFVIDYLTYGGLYREVWLDILEKNYLEDVFVTTPDPETVHVEATPVCTEDCVLEAEVTKGGHSIAKGTFLPGESLTLPCPGVKPWNTVRPVRYICRVTLKKDGKVLDSRSVKFGFRTVEFRPDGCYLNGKKVFLRGLNRHQCYPCMGYAATESLQREDARILQEELSCNAVRTSHYPQSHHFLDECDRRGILVFTEIPGWQHVGDDLWIEQALENVRDMVLQYRNHPSIVLWGVRINESQDNDDFYTRANAIARELDPSRPTSGVRFIKKSSLLEDVYAYNDFSHMGTNAGCEPKSKVTPDMGKALLISEHNGHMFPTKSFDTWERRQEQALRHARVLDAAMADGQHAGCFGWCMFDYPTHKDFGSGDRVCHHGVMDAFRNPKLAAYTYASQGVGRNVLTIGSSMDIGDYPGGTLGDVWVFTNADSVSLYKNDCFVTKLTKGPWKGLRHGPMKLDDTIGCLLETQEGFDKKKADLLRQFLLTVQKKGLAGMGPADYAKAGYAMLKYGLKYEDALSLYGKYVGNWGAEATVWRLDGEKDGKVVSSVTCCPSVRLHLEVTASAGQLREGDTYDMASVRIRILDEHGNLAPYAQLPVRLQLEGAAELVGPDVVTAEGGMTGTYIKTTGKPGTARLTVTTAQTDSVCVEFNCI